MRSAAIIPVADTISHWRADKGEGSNEYLQEHRARTKLGRGNGNGSLPSIVHFWAATGLCRAGMPDPSLDLQPDNPVLDSRSPAPLSAISRMHSSAPTLATLRRLTIRATPLSRRNVGGRIPASGKGAPC
jgi:hypothetical protein